MVDGSPYRAFGKAVPPELLGELTESDPSTEDAQSLAAHLSRDGYLLLRGAISPATAEAARYEVLERLAAVDEIEQPARDGIVSGRSTRRDVQPDLSAFWRSVCTGPALRCATHGDRKSVV